VLEELPAPIMEGVKRQLKESKNLEGEPHRAIAVLREAV
jgi:hypothetical protein